jgi:hypothetical protein
MSRPRDPRRQVAEAGGIRVSDRRRLADHQFSQACGDRRPHRAHGAFQRTGEHEDAGSAGRLRRPAQDALAQVHDRRKAVSERRASRGAMIWVRLPASLVPAPQVSAGVALGKFEQPTGAGSCGPLQSNS